MGPARLEPRLLHGVDVLGAGAEDRDPVLLRQVEQPVAVGMERRAVVHHQGGPGRERADLPVPHHPAAGGEVENAILGLEIRVQQQLLQVLEQRAAGAMHDRLRHPCRARRVQNVDGVIERQLRERDRPGIRHHEIVPGDGPGERPRLRRRIEERRQHHVLERGQAADDLDEFRAHVDRLAVVAVAVDRDQHLGLDLAEAVEHALHAEIGGARRPDRAERGRRQHRDDGLGGMRHHRRHPIARADALALQSCGEFRHLEMQLAVAQLPPPAIFGPGDDRKLVVAPPQQVLGEIELGADEPLRPRHPVAADQHLAPRPACAHVRETPQRRPEQLGMLDRPRPERAVIPQPLAVRFGCLPRERRHVGPLDALLRWLPDRLIHGLRTHRDRSPNAISVHRVPAVQRRFAEGTAQRSFVGYFI